MSDVMSTPIDDGDEQDGVPPPERGVDGEAPVRGGEPSSGAAYAAPDDGGVLASLSVGAIEQVTPGPFLGT